jgi:hypothetical protein
MGACFLAVAVAVVLCLAVLEIRAWEYSGEGD